MAQKRKNGRTNMILAVVLAVLLITAIVLIIVLGVKKVNDENAAKNPEPDHGADVTEIIGDIDGLDGTEIDGGDDETGTSGSDRDALIEEANFIAAGYDYDGAIDMLKAADGYASDSKLQAMVAEFEATKETLVPLDVTQVTHIFYHTLINNTEKVFDGDSDEHGYNVYMTTIAEFDKITQEMYNRGYVVVRLRDLVNQTIDENGKVHFTKNENIMLPPGKKGVVISVDDLSYYHYMEDDGYPDKLVVDENGDPKCHVINDDGTESIGDYDVVPRLNTFLTEHPDGAYKGARGLIALTGYNGILGYRTDGDYLERAHLQVNQAKWLEEHPSFDFEKECEDAKVVAQAIKDSGWEFASHSWGHINVLESSLERIKTDNAKWQKWVAPLIGGTDTIIFAFGADIGSWHPYSYENPKYEYLKSQGFNFFCNVDGSVAAWTQFQEDSVRQGRRNLDGYLMYRSMTESDILEDLFHVADVFDPVRPTPIVQ